MSRPSDASSEELAAALPPVTSRRWKPPSRSSTASMRGNRRSTRCSSCTGNRRSPRRVNRRSAGSAASRARRWTACRSRSRRTSTPAAIRRPSARPPIRMSCSRSMRRRRRACAKPGCVIVGKTTMPDYGMLSSGMSSRHGVTRNPWRLDRNPSGSSSGAGAACAAGYGPLHIGTDIGGSVRLPATHCGIFGMKPSQGRVPVYPPYLGRVAGPMTRSVRDAALLMNVLTGPDVRDFMSLPPQAMEYRMAVDGLSPKALRIGLLLDMKAGLPVGPGGEGRRSRRRRRRCARPAPTSTWSRASSPRRCSRACSPSSRRVPSTMSARSTRRPARGSCPSSSNGAPGARGTSAAARSWRLHPDHGDARCRDRASSPTTIS